MAGAVVTQPNRDLTAAEQKARAEQCYRLERDIKEGIRTGRALMWATAKALHDFDEAQGWSALGHERLSDWLADPEIGLTRSTYYRLVQGYRELCVIRRVPDEDLAELDVTKVQIILPALKAGEVKLRSALKDVRAMGARDLRDTYMRPADKPQATEPLPDEEEVQSPEEAEDEPPVTINEVGTEPISAEDAAAAVESPPDIQGDLVSAMTVDECLESLRATVRSELPNVHAALGACEQAIEVLERCTQLFNRVLDEVGRPEQKRMKAALRDAIRETLG